MFAASRRLSNDWMCASLVSNARQACLKASCACKCPLQVQSVKQPQLLVAVPHQQESSQGELRLDLVWSSSGVYLQVLLLKGPKSMPLLEQLLLTLLQSLHRVL